MNIKLNIEIKGTTIIIEDENSLMKYELSVKTTKSLFKGAMFLIKGILIQYLK